MSRRKKYDQLAQAKKLAQATLSTFRGAVIYHDSIENNQGLYIDYKTGSPIRITPAIHDIVERSAFKFGINLVALAEDWQGKRYIKTDQATMAVKYVHKSLVDFMVSAHEELAQKVPANQLRGVGYVATFDGTLLDEEHMIFLFEKYGAFS